MTWRKHDFKEGAFYKTTHAFESNWYSFENEELLSFECAQYSHYDCTSVFQFRTISTGEAKQWWLHDDQPIAEWTKYFVEVNQKGPCSGAAAR